MGIINIKQNNKTVQENKNDPYGHKISFMIHAIRPIDPRSRPNISKWENKFWKNSISGLGKLRLERDQINTEAKIANVIYDMYGYGVFNIHCFDVLCPNKKFKPEGFKCLELKCKYFGSCRVKNQVRRGSYNQCRANSRYRANWTKQMRISILENPNPLSMQEYIYEIPKLQNKFLLKRWSWLFKKETRKIKREEYY